MLITGATGFLGAQLLRTLKRNGHEPIAGVRRHDAAVHGCETVVWDIGEATRPVRLPTRVDAIVHAAQSRNHRTFPDDSAEMFRVNVAGTLAVLDYAAQLGVRRVCLLSSGSVYEPYRGELREDSPLAPAGLLGATKLAAEVLARPYGQCLALSILRVFFPYGPGQRARLIPDVVERVRTGTPVQLSSDGEGLWIAPIYAPDVVDIIIAAVAEGWTGTINVASPQMISLHALAEAIGDLVGRRPLFEITERESVRIAPVLDRLGARFDMGRLTPLESGLKQVVSALCGG